MLKSWERTHLTSLESVKASKNELKRTQNELQKQRKYVLLGPKTRFVVQLSLEVTGFQPR